MYTYRSRISCTAGDLIFFAIQRQFFPTTRGSLQTSADGNRTCLFLSHSLWSILFHQKLNSHLIVHPSWISRSSLHHFCCFQNKLLRKFLIPKNRECGLRRLQCLCRMQNQPFQAIAGWLAISCQTAYCQIIKGISGKDTGRASADKQVHTGKFHSHTFQKFKHLMVVCAPCRDILLIPRIEHLPKTSRGYSRSHFFINQRNMGEVSQLSCLHKSSRLFVGNPLTSLGKFFLLILIRSDFLQAARFLCIILNPRLDSFH